MKRIVSISLAFILCTTLCLSQKVIRVPQDSATIQAAINGAANGDTVLVAEGTYLVNLTINKKIVLGSLFIVDGETSHISKTILDGGSPIVGDSASVILIGAGTDSTTQIKGFTIRNGRGTRGLYDGVYWRGGLGINIVAGGARITHNTITDNSLTSGDALYGGGIAISSDWVGYWIIEHNRIIHNQLSTSISNVFAGAESGGVALGGSGRFCHNVVYENSASYSGTGTQVYGSGGGVTIAASSGTSDVLFANNHIWKNFTNKWAGGIYTGHLGGATLRVTFANNIISGNSSPLYGAGLLFSSGEHTLVNNTITNNSGPYAIWVETLTNRGPATLRMLNNILWNPSTVSELIHGAGSNPFYRYSDYNLVRGNISGTGNISSDPLFVPGDTLYRLADNSPCIGAGISSASVGGVTLTAPLFDYLNTVRPRGEGTRPDMGAMENDLPTAVDVVEQADNIATTFSMDQNFPNPFNPTTVISYSLLARRQVRLSVYDLLGREVALLVYEQKPAGRYSVKWDAAKMASGVYFYKLTAGNFVQTRRMVLMK